MTLKDLNYHAMSVMTSVIVVLVLGIIYLKFIDGQYVRKPVTFISDPMKIETDKLVYKRGETVHGTIEFCKHWNIKSKIQWSLIDHFLTIYPQKENSISKGCKELDFVIETIPKTTMPEDSLHFEGLLQYQVNPFSVVSIPLKTQSFTIL